jgi:hypothetical protein
MRRPIAVYIISMKKVDVVGLMDQTPDPEISSLEALLGRFNGQ